MVNIGALKIRLVEALDEQSLDRLVDALNLDGGGRLDDDWDYEFGSRVLKGTGIELTEIVLWRADEAPWFVKVSHPENQPPTDEELAGWRKEIIEGIKAAGLTPNPSA